MKIIKKEEALQNKEAVINWIKNGKIFVYPTDTIYGIGCDGTNDESVKKIREIKKSDQAFSVIAPSQQWILDNCVVKDQEWLNKLPGPYTLILPLIAEGVSAEVTAGKKTIGVRIPDHWFSEIVQEAGVPFVTTSANVHGQPFLTNIAELNKEVKVDVIIDEGKKEGKPSTLVDLTGEEANIIER